LARGNNVRVNTDTPLGGMRVKERIREAGHPGERVLGTRSGPHSLWVVLDGGGAPALPLGVFLPDGTEAVALFSGEEEARMFCHLGGEEGANRRVRETSAGEVLSLLYRAGRPVRRVALDPFAEVVPGGWVLRHLDALRGALRPALRPPGPGTGGRRVAVEVSLPEGYRLERDPDVLLLLDGDGRSVAAFSARGARKGAVEETAWEAYETPRQHRKPKRRGRFLRAPGLVGQ
jgi:hypothetical protein